MSELRDRLQSSLGAAYSLERELGGGGMSKVFVAEETSLGRQVVVKVLSPELSAGLSVDRFKREILVAAKLQQANIVPLLSAGEFDGLPYYTMPFVEGLSLRGRIATAGALPIAEVVGILKDAAKALAYAHEHGVVHRDIKPDNVLLSGGTAVVTDFGIAKAIAASRTQAGHHGSTDTLTQVGVSLGTPQYMAPEQAAGDPSTDHRADLYALGVMAYEMLAGRTPFHGLSLHKLLAAQMGEKPRNIAEARPDCPPMLAELVMRCLEKDPMHRPSTASDIVRVLDAVTTTVSGATGSAPVAFREARVPLWKALAWYATAAVAVPIVARASVISIGLPAWVFMASIVAMAMGLPVILTTYLVQRIARRAAIATPSTTPGGSPVYSTVATMAIKASPHMTWRRATIGGVVTVGALAVLTAGWMILRALGIGPSASLMAAGRLGEREQLLVADFRSASDSTLGNVVTEALRTDLAQSPNLRIVQANVIRETLRRMQRPITSHVDDALAREIATREGIKALLSGEVLKLGGSYVISARLTASATGEELAVFRTTADQDKDLIPAIGQLSKDLRAKVGESLRSVNTARPLERVSTPSLPALRKYVEAMRIFYTGQGYDRGARLLQEAVALDTSFAMAYRKLSVESSNRVMRGVAKEYAIKAYQHRDRLTDAERYLTEAAYWTNGPTPNEDSARAAYEALLELEPENSTPLNNIAVIANRNNDYVTAEKYYRRALSLLRTSSYMTNIAVALANQGRYREALAMEDSARAEFPDAIRPVTDPPFILSQMGQFDSAVAHLRHANLRSADGRSYIYSGLHFLEVEKGELRQASRSGEAWITAAEGLGRASGVPEYVAAVRSAVRGFFLGDVAGAGRGLDSLIKSPGFTQTAPEDRPYSDVAVAALDAGRADLVRAISRDYEAAKLADVNRASNVIFMRANVALAEKRYADAIAGYRNSQSKCQLCVDLMVARAFDGAGQRDSALVHYEAYLTRPRFWGPATDHLYRAYSMKRAGELAESRGDTRKAVDYYSQFVNLWRNADPELQPQVADVRRRIAKLQATDIRPTQKVGR